MIYLIDFYESVTVEFVHNDCSDDLMLYWLVINILTGDIVCFECKCEYKNWKFIGSILCRVKTLIQEIRKMEKGKGKGSDVEKSPTQILSQIKIVLKNLSTIMKETRTQGGLLPVFKKPQPMVILSTNVQKMYNDLERALQGEQKNADYKDYVRFINDFLELLDRIEI